MATLPDCYTLAAAAAQALSHDSSHPAARAQYFIALVGLGLHAAAQRFSEASSSFNVDTTPRPSGVIEWSSRRRRFAANVRAAAERWPELAALEAMWERSQHDYELQQSNDGNYHILRHDVPDIWRAWMGGLADHKDQVNRWTFDKAQTPLPPPLAFDGAGHGWFILHVATATERSFLSYSCPLYLVEADPIPLCILFHLHDLQALLRSPRLRLFAGASALDQLVAAFRREPTWTLPQQFVTLRLTGPGTPQLQAACESLLLERKQKADQLLAEINARYAARDVNWWHARYNDTSDNARPLRVLCITTRYSTVLRWSMGELAAAITEDGHEAELAMEADDQSLEDCLTDTIHRLDPDLLVLMSRMRHENPGLPRGVPFISWDQDNLPCMRTAETTASLDVFTYVAGHAAVYGQFHLNWPARNAIICFPAAATHRYQPRALTSAEMERYGCDFSYISNASGSPEQLRDELGRAWKSNPAGDTLFQSLSAGILSRSRSGERFDHDGLKEFVTGQAGALGFTLTGETRHEFVVALRALADRCFRHATLEWVARYCEQKQRTLKLYGAGWERHPALAAHACGRVDPGAALTAVYLASRINLQIIESGLIHSRFLDGIAAGGFFLAREFMLPHGRAIADAQYALARRATALEITTGKQLLECTDAQVRRLWQIVRAPYAEATAEQLSAVLRLWTQLVPHYIDMPHVDSIVFDDPEQFAALATRYLEEPEVRAQIAGDLRQRVLGKYSYDTRWRQFRSAIAQGLH